MHVGRRPPRTVGEHLESNDAERPRRAVAEKLPGLEDDAHAAAGDLLQQFVVAEHLAGADVATAGGAVGAVGPARAAAERSHESVEAIQVGKEGFELRGQVGMGGEELLPVRGRARLDRIEGRGQAPHQGGASWWPDRSGQPGENP